MIFIYYCLILIHKYPPPSLPWSMADPGCLENTGLYRLKTQLCLTCPATHLGPLAPKAGPCSH